MDRLYLFLWGLTAFFTLLIFLLVVFSRINTAAATTTSGRARRSTRCASSSSGTVVPLVVVLVIFFWAPKVYFDIYSAPPTRWTSTSSAGSGCGSSSTPRAAARSTTARPAGRRVKLTLTSQDVIHSFFIPAFRVKQDAVPGRYTRWVRGRRSRRRTTCSAPSTAARSTPG